MTNNPKKKKRRKRKVGRPKGGDYPEAVRKVWREYQRKRREKLKKQASGKSEDT